jgi:hypothetical protein
MKRLFRYSRGPVPQQSNLSGLGLLIRLIPHELSTISVAFCSIVP